MGLALRCGAGFVRGGGVWSHHPVFFCNFTVGRGAKPHAVGPLSRTCSSNYIGNLYTSASAWSLCGPVKGSQNHGIAPWRYALRWCSPANHLALSQRGLAPRCRACRTPPPSWDSRRRVP